MAQKSYSVGNPANYVQNWDTPIICTTGDNDFRIVYTQTMQAFNAAKLRGLPARMVLFPDEDHWCQKPQNSVLWQREFFKWFLRQIKGPPCAGPYYFHQILRNLQLDSQYTLVSCVEIIYAQ